MVSYGFCCVKQETINACLAGEAALPPMMDKFARTQKSAKTHISLPWEQGVA